MPVSRNRFTQRQYMLNTLFEVNHYLDTDLHEVNLHHHDFYEVYLLLEGAVYYSVDNRSYRLIPGDILLISPEELHQSRIDLNKSNYERMVLWISRRFMETYSTKETNLALCFDSHSPNRTNLIRLPSEHRKKAYDLTKELSFAKDAKEYASDVFCTGAMLQLLSILNHFYTVAPQAHDTPKDKGSVIVANALTYINAHYQEELSLDILAQKNFISKYYLSHEFQRNVGTSVYKYIIQKRLMVAYSLLSEHVLPKEACMLCGFGDYANFYRAFKKEYGMNPKAFAQLVRENEKKLESQINY